MDPSVIVGAGLVAIGSKEILTKILGPTADYVGGEVRNLVEKCNVNLDRIFIKTMDKLGNKLETPGAVPPRILKEIVMEGRFCEDELTAEYYAGLLANSRTANGKDDIMLPYLAVLKSLSTHQIRVHYVVYYLIKKHYGGSYLDLHKKTDRDQISISIELADLIDLAILNGTPTDMDFLFLASYGLEQNRLLETSLAHGSARKARKDENYYIEFFPTIFGADLFLMANGKRRFLVEFLEDDDWENPVIPIPSNVRFKTIEKA